MYDESLTGTPIFIGGKQVILAEDSMGSPDLYESPVLLAEGGGDHPPIWVDETRIGSLRDKFPGVPIYGLWQTIYHNKLLQKEGLEIILTGETSGFYLLHDEVTESSDTLQIWNDQYVESGEYLSDRIATHPALIPSEHGHVIHLVFGEMDLPPHQARLMAELLAEKRDKVKKLWATRAVAGVVATAIVGAAMGVNVLRDASTRGTLAQLNQQVATLQLALSDAQAGRLAEWPDPFAKLAPFVILAEVDVNFGLGVNKQTVKLAGNGDPLLLSPDLEPQEIPAFFVRARRSDGKWEVTW